MTRQRRLWILFLAAFALGGVTLLLINSPSERESKTRGGSAEPRPALWYGIYDSFRYGEERPYLSEATDRLAAIRAAGLRVVLNYATQAMPLDEALHYARDAKAAGVKVIWNLSDYRTQFGNLLTGQAEKLDFVDRTKYLPATWGYYVGDEVEEGTAEAAAMRRLTQAVETRTTRGTLYVARPWPDKVRPFAEMADYVGSDPYPICAPPGLASPEPGVSEVGSWLGEMVRRAGQRPVMVLQAFSWSQYDPEVEPCWPSAEQIAAARVKAEKSASPRLILWYCLHCITDYHPRPDSYLARIASGLARGPGRAPTAESPRDGASPRLLGVRRACSTPTAPARCPERISMNSPGGGRRRCPVTPLVRGYTRVRGVARCTARRLGT